jgi:predicted RNA binding protein YcfA (HicA-like mRNA interferase family)
MTRLPMMKPRQVLRKLRQAGFVEIHQRGSHKVLKNYETGRMVVICPAGPFTTLWCVKPA